MKRVKFGFKATPSHFILYGLIIYFILFFFGPYKYTIYSFDGVLYYCLCFFLLYFGAFIIEKIDEKYKPNYIIKYNSNRTICFVINCLSIIAIIASVSYLIYIVRLPNTSFRFGVDDLRKLAQYNRPTWSKVAEILMNFGIVTFLITSGMSN